MVAIAAGLVMIRRVNVGQSARIEDVEDHRDRPALSAIASGPMRRSIRSSPISKKFASLSRKY